MIYDISLELSEATVIYPNNPKIKINRVKSIPDASSNISEITIGSHAGTHVDSLKHVDNNGNAVDKLPLDDFYGKARVLDLTSCKGYVTADDLQGFGIQKDEIILLKTQNSLRGFREFHPDFVYLAEDTARYLADKKIRTLGVDSFSVQKFHSGNQAVHNIIISRMTLFEGLDLSKVPSGEYIFVGLPLKIKDCDGAPARAILISR